MDDRDLGRMGEHAFGHLCASVGLTANRSLEADKTGWDFLVEFDFNSPSIPEISTIHCGAIECKVQVKSSDKRDGKRSIELSNLKRLVTAPVPTFILFLEFDGKSMPQRAYLRHFDQSLCVDVLRRLHDVDREGQSHKLNKLKKVIKYNEDHLLHEVTGAAISAAIKKHVGEDVATYVTHKNEYLKSAGFENGYAELTFTAKGEETIQKLVDMSLGLDLETQVVDVEAISQRFGKKRNTPFLQHKSLKIGMPDTKPNYEGRIKVRSEKLGIPISLPGELYISPFNAGIPEHMRRVRIKSDFLDIVLNPYTGQSTCTLLAPGEHMPLRRLRDGLKVCQMLCRSDQQVYIQLDMPPLPAIKFASMDMREERIFEFQTALDAAEAGLRVLSSHNIGDDVQISLAEAIQKSANILELEKVLNPNAIEYKFDFTMESELSMAKPILFLTLYYAPIGSVLVGAFITLTGKLLPNGNKNYTMISEKKNIERILVRQRGEQVAVTDLAEAGIAIRKKYEDDYEVVSSISEQKS